MRLNYDCVRDVLLALEKLLQVEYDPDSECFNTNSVNINEIYDAIPVNNYSLEDVYYTIKNLDEAGYINAEPLYGDGTVIDYDVFDITFYGNEYINTIRPDEFWKKLRKALLKVGAFSLPIIANISTSLATSMISSQLNLP